MVCQSTLDTTGKRSFIWREGMDKNFSRLLLIESLLLCLLLSAFHLTGGLVAACFEWLDVLYSGPLESSGGDDDFFIVVMVALRLVFTAIAFSVKRSGILFADDCFCNRCPLSRVGC